MYTRIKQLRKELKLTQQEFGNTIRVARTSISQYETGETVPSNTVIAFICKQFNVSEEWLREGKGMMFQNKSRNDDVAELVSLIHELTTDEVHLLLEMARLLCRKNTSKERNDREP